MEIRKADLFPDYKQRLRDCYARNWHGTQEQFAAAVWKEFSGSDNTEHAAINKSTVSRWLNSRNETKGYMYIPSIAKVLDVDISEFVISSSLDKFQYSPNFADEIEVEKEKLAVDAFKIDLTFLQGLRNIIPDFDLRFPSYLPLVIDDFNPAYEPYTRRPGIIANIEAAETTHGKGLMQIYQNGKNRYLNECEMKIIHEFQKYVIRLFYAWSNKVQAKLNESMAAANLEYVNKNPILKNLSDDQPVAEDCLFELTLEELQKLDPYGIYTDAELKRYHLD